MPKKSKDVKYYEAVGRRKESVARVRLYLVTKGSLTLKGIKFKGGDVIINNKPAKQTLPGVCPGVFITVSFSSPNKIFLALFRSISVFKIFNVLIRCLKNLSAVLFCRSNKNMSFLLTAIGMLYISFKSIAASKWSKCP